MRVLSVVTLITPTGEYGGPVRVALNQAEALRARGHDVVVAAGTRGFASVPAEMGGVPIRLFPARTLLPRTGFAGLIAPGLARWVARAAGSFDVVHVHLARDLITLPVARRALRMGVPLVVQTHGMIDASSNPLAAPLDRALTRPVLRGAKAVLFLTPQEERDLQGVGGGDIRLVPLGNGVPESAAESRRTPRDEVLFLARLAHRKRPMVFVDAARELAAEFPAVRFNLVGPDEGEGDAVRQAVAQGGDALAWEGPIAPEKTGERMSGASVYVLPSVDEPYPMSVLEAMAAGLPVVVTDSCGLAPAIIRHGAGIVVDSSQSAFTGAVRRLLADPDGARAMGEAGARAARHEFGMAAVSAELERLYLA